MRQLLSNEKHWYAIYTKPRWEKKVDADLLRKGITSWCPIQKVERQWSDRKKIVEIPIFRSYVFIHVSEKERLDVITTEGVVNFIHYLGKPAVIRDEEIALIKQYLLEKDARLTIISDEGFSESDKVRINAGVFMENTGTVIRGGKKKVYVRIESLGQIMVVEFPAEYLSPA